MAHTLSAIAATPNPYALQRTAPGALSIAPMKTLLISTLFALLTLGAIAAEPPPLISALGEYKVAPQWRVIFEQKGKDPIAVWLEFKEDEGMSSAESYSPVADIGEPFVACWDAKRKRVWISSAKGTGYLEKTITPAKGDALRQVSGQTSHFATGVTIPAAVLAEMPADFRRAAAKWFPVAPAKP